MQRDIQVEQASLTNERTQEAGAGWCPMCDEFDVVAFLSARSAAVCVRIFSAKAPNLLKPFVASR